MQIYRKDIDGLRALAVLIVIIFHYGWLPCGYFAVDVFFVISGFLITGIIYKETVENRFSLLQFYERRVGRIIPLLLLVNLAALILGSQVMLPDDLENLSESVIATNLFGNNILQLITTHNYWDVVNEFKPLIHTWSLGVEEQYYLLYPVLFLVFRRKRIKYLFPALLTLTIISVILFLSHRFSLPAKYYLLPFRFFELSIGGMGAILFQDKLVKHHFSPLLILALVFIMHLPDHTLPLSIAIFITVFITFALLISSISYNKVSSFILENRVMVFIGKISFSLYMWHQLVLAFTRYFLLKPVSFLSIALVVIATFVLAVVSYYLIEQPFRNAMRTAPRKPFLILFTSFIIITGGAVYIYLHSGVLRDVPELDIKKTTAVKNMHGQFNAAIHKYNHPFNDSGKIRVMIIGNSFARDWANVLLSSGYKDLLDISYATGIDNSAAMQNRLKQADYIFVSDRPRNAFFNNYILALDFDTAKVYCIGTKNFGISNGLFYNHFRDTSYCLQRTAMENGYMQKNNLYLAEWGNKYINIIGLFINNTGTMPIFTPDCKFISQDCRHFTRAGAVYCAQLLEHDTSFVFNKPAFLIRHSLKTD